MKKLNKEISNLRREISRLCLEIDHIKYFEKDPYISKAASWNARCSRLQLEELRDEKLKRVDHLEFIIKIKTLIDKEV